MSDRNAQENARPASMLRRLERRLALARRGRKHLLADCVDVLQGGAIRIAPDGWALHGFAGGRAVSVTPFSEISPIAACRSSGLP